MKKEDASVSEEDSVVTSTGSIESGAEEELKEIVEEVEAVSTDESEEEQVVGEEASAVSEETGSGVSEGEDDEETMRTIFMKGLDYDNRDVDIQEQMEKIGPVLRVYVPMTHDNRRNKGFAYVEFKKLADAQKALKLNDTMFLGRRVVVDSAKPRTNFKIFTVFCKNLSFDTTKEDLQEHFNTFGPVYNISLPMDTDHEGRNRGFCFVEYKDEDVANRAMKEKHVVRGRMLYTSMGNKNEDRNAKRASDRPYGRRNDDREGGSRFDRGERRDSRDGARGRFN